MRPRRLVAAAAVAGLAGVTASPSFAHALFPGKQTVLTYGERAFVKLKAANGRSDVSSFAVEIFEGGTWTPSKFAVANPSGLTVRAPQPGSIGSTNQVISLLVDLGGKDERKLLVCTKTLAPSSILLPQTTQVNTRVCADVTVRRAP